MLHEDFKKAVKLVGGKTAIMDGEDCYVLMSLDEFKKIKSETLEGLTKQELVDRINDEINLWKQSQEEDKFASIAVEELGDATVTEEGIHYEKEPE